MSTTLTLTLDDDAVAALRQWHRSGIIAGEFANGILTSIAERLPPPPPPPLHFGDYVTRRDPATEGTATEGTVIMRYISSDTFGCRVLLYDTILNYPRDELTLVPDGDITITLPRAPARRLLQSSEHQTVADPRDIDLMRITLREALS